MNELPTHFDTPEDTYYGFFEADAAQDADAWAAVMTYPHVRVAASGRFFIAETPEDYMAIAKRDWTERVKTGWVRSRGREPVRLHETSNRVLMVGGWTRFNKRGEPILHNRVTYILTRHVDSWHIQARFGLGAYDGSDDSEAANQAAAAACRIVWQYYDALANDDSAACADLCRYPLIDVSFGEVTRIEDGAELERYLSRQKTQFSNLDISAAQAGPAGVNVAVTTEYSSGGGEQTLILVGRREGTWEIGGVSRSSTE